MKKVVTIFILLFSISSYAQDSIVNYLDYYGEKTKKQNAFSVETIVKRDTVWERTEYYRTGKIKEKGQYKDKEKSIPSGTFYEFYRDGKVTSYYTYNSVGKLDGKTEYWFDNNNLSFEGRYSNGAKIGIWKYYHKNGKVACKQYFQDFKAAKTVFYDEEGQKITDDLVKYQKPKFMGGGFNKFGERISKLHRSIRYQINGIVYITLTIDVDGKMKNFTTTDKLPKQLLKRLSTYFEKIEGWEPAIHMNRKIPYELTFPLNFRMSFWNRADGE